MQRQLSHQSLMMCATRCCVDIVVAVAVAVAVDILFLITRLIQITDIFQTDAPMMTI